MSLLEPIWTWLHTEEFRPSRVLEPDHPARSQPVTEVFFRVNRCNLHELLHAASLIIKHPMLVELFEGKEERE